MANAKPRSCENCHGSMEGKRRHARYCSDACGRDARRRKPVGQGAERRKWVKGYWRRLPTKRAQPST